MGGGPPPEGAAEAKPAPGGAKAGGGRSIERSRTMSCPRARTAGVECLRGGAYGADAPAEPGLQVTPRFNAG